MEWIDESSLLEIYCYIILQSCPTRDLHLFILQLALLLLWRPELSSVLRYISNYTYHHIQHSVKTTVILHWFRRQWLQVSHADCESFYSYFFFPFHPSQGAVKRWNITWYTCAIRHSIFINRYQRAEKEENYRFSTGVTFYTGNNGRICTSLSAIQSK